MLAKRILPCLDVKAGRVVKGVNFVNLQDAGDPVELAKVYNQAGADELVFLDITATHEDRDIIFDVVSRTAEQVFIPLTVGGGIQSLEKIKDLLRAGADKISINSGAVKEPDLINRASDRFGNQCIVIAIDARRRQDQGRPAHGQARDQPEPPGAGPRGEAARGARARVRAAGAGAASPRGVTARLTVLSGPSGVGAGALSPTLMTNGWLQNRFPVAGSSPTAARECQTTSVRFPARSWIIGGE